MAKYENEGYCPCNTVSAILASANDLRLIGLWSILGESVVCHNESDLLTVDSEAVDAMFSTDSIAYRLMETIIRYNGRADKIIVLQNHKGGCLNRQSYSLLQDTFMSGDLTNPVLIVESKSRFAVILSESADPNVIELRFWDLDACW